MMDSSAAGERIPHDRLDSLEVVFDVNRWSLTFSQDCNKNSKLQSQVIAVLPTKLWGSISHEMTLISVKVGQALSTPRLDPVQGYLSTVNFCTAPRRAHVPLA